MKLLGKSKREPRIEFGDRCVTACDATCIAEAERDRMFENLLRYGIPAAMTTATTAMAGCVPLAAPALSNEEAEATARLFAALGDPLA
jgi:hypothetical protein